YRSYAVGKWHVTLHAGAGGPKHNWPLGRGFDRFYGTIHGAGSYYDPSSLVRDNTMISPFADKEYAPATYYYTDAIADHAARFAGADRLGRRGGQEVGGGGHGGLRGDGGPHGPRRGPAGGRAETDRPTRRHADPVPARQRRLRGTSGPRRQRQPPEHRTAEQ